MHHQTTIAIFNSPCLSSLPSSPHLPERPPPNQQALRTPRQGHRRCSFSKPRSRAYPVCVLSAMEERIASSCTWPCLMRQVWCARHEIIIFVLIVMISAIFYHLKIVWSRLRHHHDQHLPFLSLWSNETFICDVLGSIRAVCFGPTARRLAAAIIPLKVWRFSTS